jgi:hypothetical protein
LTLLQAPQFQVLQIDTAFQVQRVQILDPHGGYYAASLPQLLAGFAS